MFKVSEYPIIYDIVSDVRNKHPRVELTYHTRNDQEFILDDDTKIYLVDPADQDDEEIIYIVGITTNGYYFYLVNEMPHIKLEVSIDLKEFINVIPKHIYILMIKYIYTYIGVINTISIS